MPYDSSWLTEQCYRLGCSVILGVYSGGWGISQLGEELQFKVAGSVAAAYSLLLFKIVATSSVSTSAEKSD